VNNAPAPVPLSPWHMQPPRQQGLLLGLNGGCRRTVVGC
jgi:hypothetical protein